MSDSTRTFDVTFPGGLAVEAHIGGHVIRTDQSLDEGGQDSAPSPYSLFMSSIACCSGVYAVSFCEKRGISTEGMTIRAKCEFTDKPFHMDKMTLELVLPEGFPEKYEEAILRAMNLCVVKKSIVVAPEFETVLAGR